MAATESEQRQAAADGGGDVTGVTPEKGPLSIKCFIDAGPASYSLSEAARLAGVPVRTLREWAAAGRIPTLEPDLGQRGRRVPRSVVTELQGLRLDKNGQESAHASGAGMLTNVDIGGAIAAAGDGERQQPAAEIGKNRHSVAAEGGDQEQEAEAGGACQGSGQGNAKASDNVIEPLRILAETLNDTRTDLRTAREAEAALRADLSTLQARAAALEAAGAERDFLRRQLEIRGEAERELRVLLLETTKALQALQAVTASTLPAGECPEVRTQKKEPAEQRRPWWALWERSRA